MAYQLKRSNKIIETLELCSEGGEVVHSLNVEINVDLIIKDYKSCKTALINAERKLKEAQKRSGSEEVEALFEEYGNAVLSILQLLLGAQNTRTIVEFYENRYIELSMHIMPFIYNVIQPAIEDAVNAKKSQLKSSMNRKQRRHIRL